MKYRALAHRGYPAKYAENTMSSFQAAVDLGFTHLELDVQLSKDGVPVIMHDPTVDRTTNAAGAVREYTLAELSRITVGEDESIPTLEQVLAFAKGKIVLDIELKQTGNLYPGMEQVVLDAIRKHDMLDQVFMSSFDHYSIQKLRELSEDIQLCLVYYGQTPSAFPYAKQINASYIAVRHNFITDEYIRRCMEEELGLIAWTVDDPVQMRRFLQQSNVLVCTNELERWIEVHHN